MCITAARLPNTVDLDLPNKGHLNKGKGRSKKPRLWAEAGQVRLVGQYEKGCCSLDSLNFMTFYLPSYQH